MTLGLCLPNIPSSCVTAHCLNNKRNVFFVAEKACRNLAVLISNCDSMSKKLKILLTFPDYGGRPGPKDFHKEAVYSGFKKPPVA